MLTGVDLRAQIGLADGSKQVFDLTMSYRLNWLVGQLHDVDCWKANDRILKSRWKYYFGLFWKALPVFGKTPLDLRFKDGHVIRVREFMSLYIYKEIFVDRCYDIPSLNSVDSPVIIDVGGNTGQFVLRMKQLYPNATVISFEPFPPNFVALKETININSLSDVEPVQKCVGAHSGEVELYIHPHNIGGHSTRQEMTSEKAEKVTVPMVPLSEVLQSRGLSRCDLLKLDCEGAEFDILSTLESSDLEKYPRIIFEPTSQLYSVETLLDRLRGIGYSIETLEGTIVASVK